jgi:hypothetical protein
MPQSGYEFRKIGLSAWGLALPGRSDVAYGSAGAGETLGAAMRRARHVLGYARRRIPKIEDLRTSWSWHITTRAGRLLALGACYASARGARRGYERARAAARGARIVTG